MKKTTNEDYRDFLNEILIDLMAGKDVKVKVAWKLEKLENKLARLATMKKEYITKHGNEENITQSLIG